jgi:hypothetical protein
MKSFLLKTVIATVIFAMSYYAKAGLITTTIDLTISSIQGNYANVSNGDVFQFSTTYDDSATHMLYGSDTLSLCLTTHIATPGVICNTRYTISPSTWTFMSNASSNALDLFAADDMLAAGGRFYQRSGTPYNVVYAAPQTEETFYEYSTQEYSFSIKQPSRFYYGSIDVFYRDRNNRQAFTAISYRAANFTTVPAAPPSVPEPSTLAIFALGMIGLASRRFKKQS